MYIIGYKISGEERFNASPTVYPNLDIAQKALEVEQFRSSLTYTLFQLVPVAHPSQADGDPEFAQEEPAISGLLAVTNA